MGLLGGNPHVMFERGGLQSNSQYRDHVTPVSGSKVKKTIADAEADGLEEPDLSVGK